MKHLIESLGIPHPEVACILVNRQPVDFSYLVQDGDRVDVYPLAGDLPCAPESRLSQLPADPRFVLDNHLGRLAVYLRMLGFDTLYRNDYQDEELAQVAGEEGRILLTRDRHLLMRNAVQYGYWVRNTAPRLQILEAARRFQLPRQAQPFRRCMRCNGLLRRASKVEVLDRLEPLTKLYYDDFRLCPECGGVYWKGSHYERMRTLIEQLSSPS